MNTTAIGSEILYRNSTRVVLRNTNTSVNGTTFNNSTFKFDPYGKYSITY